MANINLDQLRMQAELEADLVDEYLFQGSLKMDSNHLIFNDKKDNDEKDTRESNAAL